MSKLNVYHHELRHNEYAEFYLKYEAGKVIAELKDDVTYWKKVAKKNMDDNVAMARERAKAFESERHHKYKRCLDKAEMCKARYDAEDARVNGHGEPWDYTSNEMKYWERWQKRWLELAEQFKPNSTAPEENSDG